MFDKLTRRKADDAAAARRNTEAILRENIDIRKTQELILATLGTVTADAARYKAATDSIIEKQKAETTADEQTIAADQQTIADLHNQEIPDTLAQQIKDAADTAEAQLAALNGTDPSSTGNADTTGTGGQST